MSGRHQPTSQEGDDRRDLHRGKERQRKQAQAEQPSLGPQLAAGPWLPLPGNAGQHVAVLLAGQRVLGNRVVQRLIHCRATQKEPASEQEVPPIQRKAGDEEENSSQAKVLDGPASGVELHQQLRPEVRPDGAEAVGAPQMPGLMMGRESVLGPGSQSWQGLAEEWRAEGGTEAQAQRSDEGNNSVETSLSRLTMDDPFLRVTDGPAIQRDKKKPSKRKKKAGKTAAPPPEPKLHYYKIKGMKTLSGVARRFPHDRNAGRRVAGRVNWGVELGEIEVAEKGPFRVKSIPWKLNPLTIVMPKWENYGEASEPAKQEWDRFMGCLRIHEDGHVKRAVEDFTGIPGGWKRARGKSADALQGKLESLNQKIHNKIDKRQKKYDEETDHGASQKATLDIKIK